MDGPQWGSDMPLNPPQEEGAEQDYPFEEPEQAPELRSERSENLYRRSEPFWEKMYEPPVQPGEEYPKDPNYWNHPEELAEERLMNVLAKQGGKSGAHIAAILLTIVAVLAVLAVVLFGVVFRVRSIQVEGNSTVSAAEIIRLSGLRLNMSSLAVDEETVSRAVETNRYLRCQLVDVRGTGQVVIRVRERVPVAVTEVNGIPFLLDNRGFVLEDLSSVQMDTANLLRVKGLETRYCNQGEQIRLQNAEQLTVYTAFVVQLQAMGRLAEIRELDVTDMDRIYLQTTEGFAIRLGDSDQLHQKLRSMFITLEAVRALGHAEGMVDVSDPVNPTYMPEEY